MEKRHAKFIHKSAPKYFERIENDRVKVVYDKDGTEIVDEYDTVLLAIGRFVDSKLINADKLGIQLDKNGKIIVNDND